MQAMIQKFAYRYYRFSRVSIEYWFSRIGVNLLIGTETGLYLLDRSGNGKGEKCLFRFCLIPASFTQETTNICCAQKIACCRYCS